MTTTLDVVKSKKSEPSTEETVARELVRLAKGQGLSLTGPDGLLKLFTNDLPEAALNEELTEHLGHVQIEVPRDRDGTSLPVIMKKRQHRLNGVEEIVRSLYTNGLTTGETSVHFAQIYGAQMSRETISRITDKVIEEMNEWSSRPLDDDALGNRGGVEGTGREVGDDYPPAGQARASALLRRMPWAGASGRPRRAPPSAQCRAPARSPARGTHTGLAPPHSWPRTRSLRTGRTPRAWGTPRSVRSSSLHYSGTCRTQRTDVTPRGSGDC